MFDVGFAELFLLSVIGLLVLGPERLPAVARTIGGLVRKARSSWYSLRRQIESELAAADVTAPIKDAGNEIRKATQDVTKAVNDPLSLVKPDPEKPTEEPADKDPPKSDGDPA
jgi:sec-independent protein translocase protein TatB